MNGWLALVLITLIICVTVTISDYMSYKERNGNKIKINK